MEGGKEGKYKKLTGITHLIKKINYMQDHIICMHRGKCY